jgi:hypothetical protein
MNLGWLLVQLLAKGRVGSLEFAHVLAAPLSESFHRRIGGLRAPRSQRRPADHARGSAARGLGTHLELLLQTEAGVLELANQILLLLLELVEPLRVGNRSFVGPRASGSPGGGGGKAGILSQR